MSVIQLVSIDSAAMARLLSEIIQEIRPELHQSRNVLLQSSVAPPMEGRSPAFVQLPCRQTQLCKPVILMHKCTSCPYSVIRVKCKAFDIWLKVFINAKVQVEEPSLPYFRSHYRTVAGGYSCEAGSLTALQVFLAYVLCMYM